jgi:Ca-activated chloride channel homolog
MKNKLTSLFFLTLFAANLVSAQEIKIQFGAFDGENFFDGLKASDVRVLQNKKALTLGSFELKREVPLEIVIMIDASASQERSIEDEKKAAEYLVDNVLKKGRDKIAIVRFTGELSLEQDLTDDFARAKEQIKKIEFVPPGFSQGVTVISVPSVIPPVLPPVNSDVAKIAATSIWDSIKQVSEAVAKVKSSGARRAIIIFTDGFNTYGETKLKEAVASSMKTNIPIYAVGIGDEFYGGVDKKTLDKITEQTNGVLILPKKELKNFSQQAQKFEQALHSVYEITFAASGAKDELQEIKIEIINPELRKKKLEILQPKGYFAP